MILLVHNDIRIRQQLQGMLESEGYQVVPFGSPVRAIIYLRSSISPNLIVSSFRMPKFDGFGFRSEVKKLQKHSGVPFFFLTSPTDKETVTKALARSEDSYLSMPVKAPLFKEKVRAILQKQHLDPSPTFYGTLEKLPFPKIFQFCESKGLSGRVRIESKAFTTTLQFVGGELDYDSLEESEDTLEKLCRLTTGTFQISQRLTSFDEIRDAAISDCMQHISKTDSSGTGKLTKVKITQKLMELRAEIQETSVSHYMEPTPEPASKPMGMLSGVRINQKLLQVQTEYHSTPTPSVVTIVVYKGKTIHTKVDDTVANLERKEIEAVIRAQHQRVEDHIRGKLCKSATDELLETRCDCDKTLSYLSQAGGGVEGDPLEAQCDCDKIPFHQEQGHHGAQGQLFAPSTPSHNSNIDPKHLDTGRHREELRAVLDTTLHGEEGGDTRSIHEAAHSSGEPRPTKVPQNEINSKIHEAQLLLKSKIKGFFACGIQNLESGLTLARETATPSLGISISADHFTKTLRSSVELYKSAGWGIPNEVLISGKTHNVILFSLKKGQYCQGIAFSKQTPLGLVIPLVNKLKPNIEVLLP